RRHTPAAACAASRAGRRRRRRSVTAGATAGGRCAGRPAERTAAVTTPDAVRAMLGARSVAVVGASSRPGSFGERLVTEVLRSPSAPEVTLVNPRYDVVAGRPCVPSLRDLAARVDLVLLAVNDTVVEQQLTLAAERGDRSAVVFGSVWSPQAPGPSLRQRVTAVAEGAGMALCGGGC